MEKRQERTLTNGDTEAATCQRGFQARQRERPHCTMVPKLTCPQDPCGRLSGTTSAPPQSVEGTSPSSPPPRLPSTSAIPTAPGRTGSGKL
ncbi:uncharacterized protein [Symphalangus syndactylus]|uniref:uncharacterized protein isoform X3 n=1 Tax=Symphalangus syndactylus TaxID=9590 RepID=UPI002442DC43|nr:uncharacterized protein LOC129472709 isoform X3 [Symphalangus syndactylus]